MYKVYVCFIIIKMIDKHVGAEPTIFNIAILIICKSKYQSRKDLKHNLEEHALLPNK